jgi:hypothetical protein
VQIFRSEPSIALKSGVTAAVSSWVIVAIPNVPQCVSDNGVCLLASPAMWLYWAPVFVVAWAIVGGVMVAIQRRKNRQ